MEKEYDPYNPDLHEIKEACDCEYYLDKVGIYHMRKIGDKTFWLHARLEGVISEAVENQSN